MHIPKCAGTSLARAFETSLGTPITRIHPPSARLAARQLLEDADPVHFFRVYPEYQQFLLLYHLNCGERCLSGHLPVGKAVLRHFRTRYAFVTLLRDPVQRWISHYVYFKLTNSDRLTPPCCDHPAPPSEELESILTSWRGWQLGHLLTTFLCGFLPDSASESQAVAEAQDNLRLFRVVGFVEDLPTFECRLRETLGIVLSIPHLNTRDSLPAESSLIDRFADLFDTNVRNRIRAVCAADYAVYHAALEFWT